MIIMMIVCVPVTVTRAVNSDLRLRLRLYNIQVRRGVTVGSNSKLEISSLNKATPGQATPVMEIVPNKSLSLSLSLSFSLCVCASDHTGTDSERWGWTPARVSLKINRDTQPQARHTP